MIARKHLARIVFAAGVLASIASTPVINRWQLDASEGLVPQVLDDTTPLNVRSLTATLTSTEPLPLVSGNIAVHLQLRARDVTGVNAAQLEVELVSMQGAGSDRRPVLVMPGNLATVVLSVPALDHCLDTVACTERFELRLRRESLPEDPTIEITGIIELEAFGDDVQTPPPGAVLALDVADLGPLP
ncbi:MAG TPA: hypothetical protein VNO30_49595 [Kofleriaceae bacterium]|nr:hypothetical protein [Kofleriaceae bacterium]